MNRTPIEWATHSASYQAGCTKVSAACTHCYAIPQSARLERMGQDRYAGVAVHEAKGVPRWTGRVTADIPTMDRIFMGLVRANPNKPRRLFLNSMTDTFHEDVPERILDRLAHCFTWNIGPHVVLVLTKRSRRMLAFQRTYFPKGLPPNVWMGVTAEDMPTLNERAPDLLETRAAVRFLSCEPLLGSLDRGSASSRRNTVGGGFPLGCRFADCAACGRGHGFTRCSHTGGIARRRADATSACEGFVRPTGYDAGISWVITGGESGPGARPSSTTWFREARDACEDAGVPYFHKQNGVYASGVFTESTGHRSDGRSTLTLDGEEMVRRGKAGAGRALDGKVHGAIPEAHRGV